MLKLKKLIAGALLSASLASPLPAYAAEAAAEAPAAAVTVAAGAEALNIAAMDKMAPTDYLIAAEKATAAEPSANVDIACTLTSPLGQAVAQVSGSYVISDPTANAADGFRPKIIDPKTDKADDNIFVMEGNLTLALRSFMQSAPGKNIPFYVKADKNIADVYTYDDEKSTWTHYQQKVAEAEKAAVAAATVEKDTIEKTAKVLSDIKIDKVVKDAPTSANADTRSLTVEIDLRSVLDAMRKNYPQLTIPEIKDEEAAKLLMQVDVERKTAHITREAGDLTKFARYLAHAFLDNAKNLDAMHQQMINSMVDTSTVQFDGRFSGFGAIKNIMIPTAALEAPVTEISKKNEAKSEPVAPAKEPAEETSEEK